MYDQKKNKKIPSDVYAYMRELLEEEGLTEYSNLNIEFFAKYGHLSDAMAKAIKKGELTTFYDFMSERLTGEAYQALKYFKEFFTLNKNSLGLKIIKEGVYDSIVSKLAKEVLNTWKGQFDKDPKRLFSLLDTSYEFEDAKGRPLDFKFLAKLDFKKTKDRTYEVDGGADEGDDENEGFVALNFQVDPRELPRMWSTIAMDIRDVLRHEIEHLTQGGWNERSGKYMEDDQFIRDLIQKYKTLAPKNYFLLDKEVDAMLQGMYFKAKKARRPFTDVIEDYLDTVGLEPEEKEEIKTRWRGRVKALSLPLFEELDWKDLKEQSEEGTVNIDLKDINGKKVVLATMDGEKLGALRLKPYLQSYQVDSVIVKPEYRGFGIGKEMYRLAHEKLGPLYSDAKQTPDAENLWKSLIRKGEAKKQGDRFVMTESKHEPMNPGILKKRLGKLSCTKVRKERQGLKDKGTTYAKALQRYLNYHCQ